MREWIHRAAKILTFAAVAVCGYVIGSTIYSIWRALVDATKRDLFVP